MFYSSGDPGGKSVNVDFLSLRIENSDIDQEKRVVRGVFISEEPNNQDAIFDYATSKPYISRWSRKFAADTNGKSKGNVRAMHGLTKKGVELVGVVVEINYNDKAKQIEGAVKVVDDECWTKVKEGVITGFSFGGDSVGAPWKDKIASAKHGRPMKRYTFAPRELTLCDRGRIPGTEFTSIENADIATQEPTMDPNEIETPVVDAPVADLPAADPAVGVPVVDEPVVEEGSQSIENGVGMANQFGSIVEMLAYMVKEVEREESAEGDSPAIPSELRAALKGLIESVKAYQAKQLDELMPEESMENSDFDIDDDDAFEDLADLAEDDGSEIVENGDYPGHPFRGNQHTGGKHSSGRSKSGKSGSASKLAHRASVAAHSGGAKGHRQAATAHKAAHAQAMAAGRKKVAAYHKSKVEFHQKEAKLISQAKSFQNADAPIENADTKAHAVIDLSPLEALVKAQGEQIAALTQRIENADTKPARNRPNMTGVVVLRDPIENADFEKHVEAEVQRVASLPPEQRALEAMKVSMRSTMVQ
jgi:hypothetical protein